MGERVFSEKVGLQVISLTQRYTRLLRFAVGDACITLPARFAGVLYPNRACTLRLAAMGKRNKQTTTNTF